MARRRHATFESSSLSESDSDSASSRKISPTSSVEKSAPSTEPLKGGKRQRKTSSNDNDDKTKSSKRPQSTCMDLISRLQAKKYNEESSYPEYTQDPGEIHLGGAQQVVITAICAADLALGLRRIPAGFHVVVKADGAEYQTSNKSVHIDQAVVEWHECILLPCKPSSNVRVSVYASFELRPMLCHGELLRTFEISVRELLDRSGKSYPIIFSLKQEEVISACTSLFMTLEQRLSDENDAAVLCPPLPTDAGHGLIARYRTMQNHRDLDQSINHLECAFGLCSMNDPYRPAALFNLATAKFVSCQADGGHLDLDIPINLFQDALNLRPTDHPDRTVTQLHLAISLLSRFAKRGFRTDADAAQELLSEVLDVCHANSHIYRAALIAIETSALHSARSIDVNDLGRERPTASMLTLSPNQLADRAGRCLRIDDPHGLDEVIFLHYDALGYYNAMHACRGQLLCNLGAILCTRFKCRGNDEELDPTISIQGEALALYPIGHTGRPSSLNTSRINSPPAFTTESHFRGKRWLCAQSVTQLGSYLDQAIALHGEVLALRPVGHTDRSMSLNNLATELSSRFDHRGNDKDLDQAIAFHREALALRPVGRPDRSISLNNLENRLYTRFKHQDNREDLDESRENLYCALTLLTQHGPRQLAAHASLASVHLSLHQSGLDGTSAGKDTAAANVVSGGSLSRLRASICWVWLASQHSHGTELEAHATSMQLLDAYMSTTASLSSRHNIMNGDVCRAVELLEQGRTIIWTQMTRLCTPLDSFQTRGDHTAALMKKFRDLSSLLDKPPANYPEATPRVDVEAEETRYRRLVEDWNRAGEDIRKIEGLSRFLLPPLFSDLQDAARDGLSSCSSQAMVKLQRTSSPALIKALVELWDDVVRPVVENLGGFARQGSRIWWCPTKHGQFLSQLYISSYTPSFTALIKARRSHDRSLTVSFAAIGQNRPANASFTLDCVEPELELVQSLLPPPPTVSFTKITSVDATKSRALRTLQDNTWLHFSCHGTQAYKELFKSAFLMRGQPLSLLDIAQMDQSRHQFAFLSACETAVGDFRTPDEVVHLAAGLQFAGVKSVIGTLWKVNDSTVQRLVEAFYKNLCGDGTMNSRRAARALHRAVQSLACDKDMPLDQRIVFVHIGI
ncbi:hypothetical protein BDR05DRAFT_991223 [Suillus weaverae]|nr:hypothetical protein BDR05DRAFT_991223 [Suillus weaverae]